MRTGTDPINRNIRFLRERAGWTQKELAERLGVKQPVIGSYEEGRSCPPIPTILRFADVFKIPLELLLREDLAVNKKKLEKALTTRGRDVLSITVDRSNKENIEIVSQKVSAGYLTGYSDPEFVKELPKISLPKFSGGATYRAFEVKGDSMLPANAGDVIVGSYVENLAKIQNGRTHIVVCDEHGIVYKRVFSFIDVGRLLLVSDNRLYDPFTVEFQDVREVWAFVSRITYHEEVVEAPTGKVLDFIATRLMEQLKER